MTEKMVIVLMDIAKKKKMLNCLLQEHRYTSSRKTYPPCESESLLEVCLHIYIRKIPWYRVAELSLALVVTDISH